MKLTESAVYGSVFSEPARFIHSAAKREAPLRRLRNNILQQYNKTGDVYYSVKHMVEQSRMKDFYLAFSANDAKTGTRRVIQVMGRPKPKDVSYKQLTFRPDTGTWNADFEIRFVWSETGRFLLQDKGWKGTRF